MMDDIKRGLAVSIVDDETTPSKVERRADMGNGALRNAMERINKLTANMETTIADWTPYDFLAYWIVTARSKGLTYTPSVKRDMSCFKRHSNLYGKLLTALCIEYIFNVRVKDNSPDPRVLAGSYAPTLNKQAQEWANKTTDDWDDDEI